VDLNLTPQEQRFRDEVRAWFAEHVPKDWVKRRDEEESGALNICALGSASSTTQDGPGFRGPRSSADAAHR
jgi:hypothetical protein